MPCHALYARALRRETPLMTQRDIISLQNMRPASWLWECPSLPTGSDLVSVVEHEFIS